MNDYVYYYNNESRTYVRLYKIGGSKGLGTKGYNP